MATVVAAAVVVVAAAAESPSLAPPASCSYSPAMTPHCQRRQTQEKRHFLPPWPWATLRNVLAVGTVAPMSARLSNLVMEIATSAIVRRPTHADELTTMTSLQAN